MNTDTPETHARRSLTRAILTELANNARGQNPFDTLDRIMAYIDTYADSVTGITAERRHILYTATTPQRKHPCTPKASTTGA